MNRRRLVLVMVLLVLGVGAVSLQFLGLFEPAGSAGGAGAVSYRVERGQVVRTLPNGAEEVMPAPAFEDESFSPAADLDPSGIGSLVARLGSVPAGADVRLGLVRCEPTDDTVAQVSLGGDEERYAHVGKPIDPSLASGSGEEGADTSSELSWGSLSSGAWQLVALEGSTHVPAGASGMPVWVRAEDTTILMVDLVRNGAIRCRVLLPDDEAVPGADVRLFGPLDPGIDLAVIDPGDLVGLRASRLLTDEGGLFRMDGLAVGASYGVHAWTEEGVWATGVLRAQPPGSEAEVLRATAPHRVNVLVQESGTGKPIANAQVLVMDDALNRLRGLTREQCLTQPLRTAEVTDERGLTTLTAELGSWLFVADEQHDLGVLQVTETVVASDPALVVLDVLGSDIVRVTTSAGWPVAGARIEARLQGGKGVQSVTKALNIVASDARGEFRVSELGKLPEAAWGNLNLFATHETEGSGGVALNMSWFLDGVRGLPKTIVLRKPGALQIDVETAGWSTPAPGVDDPRHDRAGLDEQAAKDHLLRLKLTYLGSHAPRMELSAQNGILKTVDIDAWEQGLPETRFENLEPGYYAVEIQSIARGVLFVTPALRVFPGETTHYWVASPRPELHAGVTLEVDPLLVGASSDFVTLLPEGGPVLQAATPGIMSPEAGLSDRRANFDAAGHASFVLVRPGRYMIGFGVKKEDGGIQWHQTATFQLGPGDERHLTEVAPQAAPFGVVVY